MKARVEFAGAFYLVPVEGISGKSYLAVMRIGSITSSGGALSTALKLQGVCLCPNEHPRALADRNRQSALVPSGIKGDGLLPSYVITFA